MNYHGDPETAIELVRSEIAAVGSKRTDALTMVENHQKLVGEYLAKMPEYNAAIQKLEDDLAKLAQMPDTCGRKSQSGAIPTGFLYTMPENIDNALKMRAKD